MPKVSIKIADLKAVPWDMLKSEYKKRKASRVGAPSDNEVMRKCLGCKKQFNARQMRAHPCPSGMIYHKRIGWTYDAETKRYVPPPDWVFDPVKRRYNAPK